MRFVLTLTLMLSATLAEAASDPSQLYRKSCGACHEDASKLIGNLGWVLNSKTPEDRSEWLDDFIKAHHSPDAKDRAAIAAWLSGLAGKDEP